MKINEESGQAYAKKRANRAFDKISSECGQKGVDKPKLMEYALKVVRWSEANEHSTNQSS